MAAAIIGGVIGLFLLIIAVIVLLVGQSGTTTAASPVGPSPTPRIGVLPPAGVATPTAIAPLAPSPAISGDHPIVVAGGTSNPVGQMRYTTALPNSVCSGGCGTFAGMIALRQVRVTGANEFVVDVEITITDASGDPWLFNNGQGDIVFEVAGTKFTPTGNRNLPTQVTAKGTFSGYLTFAGRIPLIASGQYPVKLSIPSRLSQPLEGWLK